MLNRQGCNSYQNGTGSATTKTPELSAAPPAEKDQRARIASATRSTAAAPSQRRMGWRTGCGAGVRAVGWGAGKGLYRGPGVPESAAAGFRRPLNLQVLQRFTRSLGCWGCSSGRLAAPRSYPAWPARPSPAKTRPLHSPGRPARIPINSLWAATSSPPRISWLALFKSAVIAFLPDALFDIVLRKPSPARRNFVRRGGHRLLKRLFYMLLCTHIILRKAIASVRNLQAKRLAEIFLRRDYLMKMSARKSDLVGCADPRRGRPDCQPGHIPVLSALRSGWLWLAWHCCC